MIRSTANPEAGMPGTISSDDHVCSEILRTSFSFMREIDICLSVDVLYRRMKLGIYLASDCGDRAINVGVSKPSVV